MRPAAPRWPVRGSMDCSVIARTSAAKAAAKPPTRVNGKRPAGAGLLRPVTGLGGAEWRGRAWRPESGGQESPRCLSSQRCSRLLMKELRGLPDFRAALPDLALPLELRMVA